MLRLSTPQPGWWQLRGVPADRVDVVGAVEVRVTGLDGTIIPDEETHGVVELFSQGERITDQGFLSLLEVRAWLHMAGERLPLPVEVDNATYRAYFVNLKDGHHRLEVQVAAPTFRHHREVPFVVANPLRVEFRQAADGPAEAWLQFNHAQVDYATIKAAGKIRIPPGKARLVPAEKQPGGLWRIPLEARNGVLEHSFSFAGNLLNKKGFYVKTKPQTIQLPLTRGPVVLRFDAAGRRLQDLSPQAQVAEAALQTAHAFEKAPEIPTDATSAPPVPVAAVPEVAPPRLIPLWFVGVISVLNLLLGGVIWWLFRPLPLPFDPSDLVPEAA